MKKLFFVLTICIALLSCTQKENEAPVNTNEPVSMKATIAGVPFVANIAVIGYLQGSGTPKVLGLQGKSAEVQIVITISAYTGPGTYSIEPGNSFNTAIYSQTAIAPYTSYSASGNGGSGSITVTSEVDGYAEGTFYFLAINNSAAITTKNITAGTFKIKIN